VTFDLAAVQKNAQHFIWLFSYDYINTPQGRPWHPNSTIASRCGVCRPVLGRRPADGVAAAATVAMAALALTAVCFTTSCSTCT